MIMNNRWISLTAIILTGASIFLSVIVQAAETQPSTKVQQTFASPDDAVKSLVEAIRATDKKALLKVLGTDASAWLYTGDKIADESEMGRFIAKYDAKNSLELEGDNKAILNVGDDAWPFPAPIVKKGGVWKFDAAAGREELINRRVGRNELSTIQTLRAIVDAQREYAAADADQNGFHDYARKFKSSPGKKDGLYWPNQAGEPESPLGPLLAVASNEGYTLQKAKRQPYHGYYYKILTKQGKDAQGGTYNYLVKGKLLGGFAILAYPVSYGVSGVQSFMVNHDAIVYEKNLGSATSNTASKITSYNLDSSWSETSDTPSHDL
jgi:hypothetical protein